MSVQVNNQVEEMVNAWTRFQGQWWDTLFGIGNGNRQTWDQLYARPLQASEDMVSWMLRQQSEWIRICMKNLQPGNGAPRIASEWGDQMESAAQHCIDAQRQAWTTWFAAIRQMDPSRLQGQSRKDATGQVNSVFDAWNQATHKTLQAQADLVSSLVATGEDVVAQSSKATGSNGAQEAIGSAKKAASKAASSAGSESRRSAS